MLTIAPFFANFIGPTALTNQSTTCWGTLLFFFALECCERDENVIC